MQRVLVTGGAGFIGSHVVALLLERGCQVMSFDCLMPQVHPQSPVWPDYQPDQEGLDKYFGDVRGGEHVVMHALREFKPDTVIHLAALVGVGQSNYEPAMYTSCNVTGTMNLLQWIMRYNRAGGGVSRVFIAGSMSSYGEGAFALQDGSAFPVATPERLPFEPSSVYAWTKAEQERGAVLLADLNPEALQVVTGRFFNVYGPNQALTNPYTGVGAIFSARIMAGLAPLIFGDGTQSRDFVHVSDVARAVLTITEKGDAGEAYNVGTGKATSILALAKLLCDKIDPTIQPELAGCYRKGDIQHCWADNSKLRALGWEPQIALEDGIDDLVAWVKSQPVATQELLDRSIVELVQHKQLLVEAEHEENSGDGGCEQSGGAEPEGLA